MGFYDVLGSLRTAAETVEGADLTVYDDLTSSYRDLEEGSAAKVAELTAMIDALNAEISQLKAVNYDLLMSSGAPGGETVEEDDNNDGEPDEEITVDDLFDDNQEGK